jgi:parvulin-like peptidyl-prolyl isomerase
MRSPSSPLFVALLAALVVLSGGCERVAPNRVATINGEAVMGNEFDAFLSAKLGDFSHEPLSDSVKSQLFDDFVQRQVTLQEARQRGLRMEPIEARAQTSEDEPIRAEIASDLLVAQYYREVVLRDVTVSPEEVASYYEAHKSTFARSGGYCVREIRVPTREEAERLRSEIASERRDFGDVAQETSAASVAQRGGLSFYQTGQLPSVLEKAIEPLAVGQVSPVVSSSFGFHVFRLESRSDRVPLDRVRDEIASRLRTRKNDQLVQADAARLLGRAHVDIDPEKLRFQYEGRFAKP